MTGTGQSSDRGTMRIELPGSLLRRVICVWYLYQQRKCSCNEVRTLGKHLCLQDQECTGVNQRNTSRKIQIVD